MLAILLGQLCFDILDSFVLPGSWTNFALPFVLGQFCAVLPFLGCIVLPLCLRHMELPTHLGHFVFAIQFRQFCVAILFQIFCTYILF